MKRNKVSMVQKYYKRTGRKLEKRPPLTKHKYVKSTWNAL